MGIRMLRGVLLFGGLAMLSGAAQGQVFKCVDKAGQTTYQERPCAESVRSEEMRIRTPSAARATETPNFSVIEFRQSYLEECMQSTPKVPVPEVQAQLVKFPQRIRAYCDCSANILAGDRDVMDRVVKGTLQSREGRMAVDRLSDRAIRLCLSKLM